MPNNNAIKTQFSAVSNDPEEIEKLILKWSKFDVIDIQDIEQATEKSQNFQEENTDIYAIDVFSDMVKLKYSSSSHKFEPCREKPSYLAAPKSRILMHIERFLIAKDRITQHPSFKTQKNDCSLINSIDSLIGCRGEKIVVGILTRVDGKNWVLEDLNSSIKLEFSNSERNSGFFCEGCIVLVQGMHFDGIFKVYCIAQPPINWLSIEPFINTSEKWNIPWPDHSLIIILANVHLDDSRILELLDKMFQGYSKYSNIMFVFIGNFSSQKSLDTNSYKIMFDNLIEIISKYEILKTTAMWVFVPGPNDPGLGEFMPRQGIPLEIVENIQELTKWKLSSNPTKLSFCDKKIVVVRTENLRKMQRTTAVEPNYEENSEPEAHLAHTLLKQAHLCPTLHTLVLPDYDYALRIDQSIDFLCVAESTKSFIYTIDGVTVFNPGHFSRYSSFITMTGKTLKPEQCSLE